MKLLTSLALVGLASLVSFLNPAHAKPLDPIAPEEMNRRLAELTYTPWSGTLGEKKIESRGYCHTSQVTIDVTDPLDGKKRTVELRLTRPKLNSKVPLMIIVPTIEGVTLLEPAVAGQLCYSDIASIIADVNLREVPDVMPAWGIEDRNNRAVVQALRTILDFAERDPRFDGSKLGIMGLSQGGITAALMAGVEPERLKAVVVTVGGGNYPYILAQSDNDAVSELRARRMKYLGLSDEAVYEDELRKMIHYDPYYFASRANRDRILMILAERDTKVPFLVQKEQYLAFGKPEYMFFTGGHVGSLISLTYLYMDTVIAFVKSRFERSFDLVPEGAPGPGVLLGLSKH